MASRRRNPYPGLTVVALVPALLFGGCWRFADGKAPDEVAVSVGDSIPVTSTPTTIDTPLLSVRRAPAVLSRESNSFAFLGELQPLLDSIDSSACFAISIDGEPVAAVN